MYALWGGLKVEIALTQHTRLHTGEDLWACEVCKKLSPVTVIFLLMRELMQMRLLTNVQFVGKT